MKSGLGHNKNSKVSLFDTGSLVACERRRISGCRFTPPKNNVCENEPRKNFRDVKAFVLLLANKIPW